MFYKNKGVLKTALSLMVNNPDDLLLMQNINKSFDNVDTDDIADKEIQELCIIVKSISKDIISKGIRTRDLARSYIENSSLPDDIKRLLLGLKSRASAELVDTYNYFFTKVRSAPDLEKKMDDLNLAFDNFQKAGIENVKDAVDGIVSATRQYEDVIKELVRDVKTKSMFVVDVSKDESKSIGMERLEQRVNSAVSNRLRTGMWIDNLTGGGFASGYLYLVSSVAGGFKSGFLQNVAERISQNMKPEDFILEEGLTPAIYYLNLEMMDTQTLQRKLSFYGIDYDEIVAKVHDSEGGTSLDKELSKVLKKKSALLPVVYTSGLDEKTATKKKYDVVDIELDMADMRLYGYQVVCVVIDYADLLADIMRSTDQTGVIANLVHKVDGLKEFAKKFNVPVISAIQMNREAEKKLKESEHKAGVEDILLKVSSSELAKAYAIKAIPEQIYLCYKFDVDDKSYFSIVVDKDRQSNAKFIPNPKRNTDKQREENRRKKKSSGRVYYVAPLEGFKISEDYGGTIRDFEVFDDDDIMNTMSVDSVEK